MSINLESCCPRESSSLTVAMHEPNASSRIENVVWPFSADKGNKQLPDGLEGWFLVHVFQFMVCFDAVRGPSREAPSNPPWLSRRPN